MARMNWKAIASNLSEAREELQSLEAMVTDPKRRNDGAFLVGMLHAFHHLNFAWNVRSAPMSRYANLSDADFNRWGRFPRDLPSCCSPAPSALALPTGRCLTSACSG